MGCHPEPLDRPQGHRAVRDGKRKLVAKGARGRWELYHLEKDRGEMNDLAGSQPALVRKMAGAYHDWARRCNVVPFGSWKRKRWRHQSARTRNDHPPFPRPPVFAKLRRSPIPRSLSSEGQAEP